MKRKFVSAVSAAACMSILLCACSSGEEENVFTGDKTEMPAYQANLDAISPAAYSEPEGLDLEPGTYISVIGKEENTAYWQRIKAGVQQAADDLNNTLGYSGSDAIKVVFNAPAKGEDIDEQVNILDEELARYPDVIAIASIDEDASAVQFDLATENGIPIVSFDSRNVYQGIQCTCRTDNTAAASTAAAHLCEAIDDQGEIALIVHDSVSESAKERETALKEEIASNHPEVSVVETIYMDQLDELKRSAAAEQLGVSQEELEAAMEGDSSEEEEQEESAAAGTSEENEQKLEEVITQAESMSDEAAVAYYLDKHPELAGCFGTNASATQLAVSALNTSERIEQITVMGFDAGKEQLASLENGEVDGLLVQNPFGIGYAAVIASARTVLEIGNEAEVDTGYVWVTQDNREDESVSAMLYE